jgi:hypothetical protein
VLAALKAVQSDMATMQTEMKTLQETVYKGHKRESREESDKYVPLI